MDLEELKGKLTLDATGFTAGTEAAKKSANEMGTKLDETGKKAEQAGEKVKASGNKFGIDFVKGIAGATTAAVALYGSFDRLEKGQLAIDKANLAVTRSTEAVDQAQKNYNDAVSKFGPSSAEAQDAADKLGIAQADLQLKTETAAQKQGDLNQSYIALGATIIPAAITATEGLGKAWKNLGPMAEGLKGTLGGVNDMIGNHKLAFIGLGAAMAGMAFSIAAVTSKSQEEKIAYSALAGITWGLAAATAAAAIAKAALGGGAPGAIAVAAGIGVGLAAGAFTYFLSNSSSGAYSGGEQQVRRAGEVLPDSKGFKLGMNGITYDKSIQTNYGRIWSRDGENQAYDEQGGLYVNQGQGWEPINKNGQAMPLASGGIVTRPTYALIGEAGPEAVIPLSRGGGGAGVPALAAGGIVTSPTLALIGESGPEAVIPLSRGGVGAGINISIVVNGSVGMDRFDQHVEAIVKRALGAQIRRT